MNLRYDYRDAFEAGNTKHAQVALREFGITYEKSTPQSLGDQFWFWHCGNIPDNLPSYITELEADESKWI